MDAWTYGLTATTLTLLLSGHSVSKQKNLQSFTGFEYVTS